MFKKWVFFISSRYIRADRKGRKISPGVFSAAGLAVGVMALISVISVMNGFQMGFIEDILEISSYHLRIENSDEKMISEIRNIDGVRSTIPFYETKTLLNSPYNIEPCLVKGIPAEAESLDPEFFEQLNIVRGGFKPEISDGIVMGRILALRLGVDIGEEVSVVALNGGTFKKLNPETTEFTLTGIFQSGYTDFDSSMIIMSDYSLRKIDEIAEPVLGIKLENRFKDNKAAERIIKQTGILPENIISWRSYNKAFFSALRLEKSVMTVMLGLIFLVVSFGIFNSTRRTIAEKQEEVGILRAIGSTPVQIRQIFVIDGLIIGLAGGMIGALAGILITVNINKILKVLSLNSASFLVNVPVRIMPGEVVLIFLFAVIFCVISAYTASAKVSNITPQEVLRYE